jgi:branched-chain amino acid aminotransferase
MWVFLNDRFVREEDARVSVFDHGFLYGDGVYETLRSYGSRIFMRDQHLKRLRRSADAIGLRIPIAESHWPDLLHEAMQRNEVGTSKFDAYLRITVSRGAGDIGLDPALCPQPTAVIMAKALRPAPPRFREAGVSLTVAKTKRNLPEALSPHIKATNFLNNILAKRESVAAGTFDSILLNWRDELAECTVSNLFFVSAGTLQTPALECGILDGITRNLVVTLAKEAGLRVEEGRYQLQALKEADECFVTNTSLEIMPATKVDGRPIGNGLPGPLTRRLHELFRANRARFLEPPRSLPQNLPD